MWRFIWGKLAEHYYNKMCATSLTEQPEKKNMYRLLYIDCIDVKWKAVGDWRKVAIDVILYPIRERMN